MPVRAAVRHAIRAATPWWAKAALKLAVAHVPPAGRALRAAARARHGEMEDPRWAYDTFRRHFDRADFPNKAGGFRVLELGPGDSLFTAVIARALGAAATWLVDVGPFASTDPCAYRRMADLLRAEGLEPPDLSAARSLDDVLAACGARYAIGGLTSLRCLPGSSCDFVFSNAVLQSVPRDELPRVLCELRRVLRTGAACVHSVDLRDMMGLSLHHLRFSQRAWESRPVRRSGFYSNRFRLGELIDLCRRCRLRAEVDELNAWPALPLPRSALAPPYRDMPEDELRVATVRLILHPV
jgi:SAM-dependent methyltransferase